MFFYSTAFSMCNNDLLADSVIDDAVLFLASVNVKASFSK